MKTIATGLLFPEGPVARPDGSLLIVEIERRTVTRVEPNGATSIVANLDGGPNGLAVGPDGALYICNNGGFLFTTADGWTRTRPGAPEGYVGGWIERLNLQTGERRRLYEFCGQHRLVGPNDLVFDTHGDSISVTSVRFGRVGAKTADSITRSRMVRASLRSPIR